MYAGLCCMLIFDFRLASKKNSAQSFLRYIVYLVFPALLGGSIEILQPLYFGRGGSWFDFLANITGIISAWIFMHIFEGFINKIFVRRRE